MRCASLISLALSFSLSLVPFVTAADDARAKFVKLAQANNGVVKLDTKLHDEIVASGRDWSVIIEYTALGKDFNCAPCQYVSCVFRSGYQLMHCVPSLLAHSRPTSRLSRNRGRKCRKRRGTDISLLHLTLQMELQCSELYVLDVLFSA